MSAASSGCSSPCPFAFSASAILMTWICTVSAVPGTFHCCNLHWTTQTSIIAFQHDSVAILLLSIQIIVLCVFSVSDRDDGMMMADG
jgi:hypothetical protein